MLLLLSGQLPKLLEFHLQRQSLCASRMQDQIDVGREKTRRRGIGFQISAQFVNQLLLEGTIRFLEF